jgi:hypothetical protein
MILGGQLTFTSDRMSYYCADMTMMVLACLVMEGSRNSLQIMLHLEIHLIYVDALHKCMSTTIVASTYLLYWIDRATKQPLSPGTSGVASMAISSAQYLQLK